MTARVLVVGPQGSGKGTQGVHVAQVLGVPVVSTGDVFRENITAGTPLGQRVQDIINAGNLVPDEVTGEVVRDRLDQPDAREGFVLDGYPRNRQQGVDLDEFLQGRGQQIDVVIVLDVPREESISRLIRRAHEQNRSDDTEEVIAHRLDIYQNETAPLVDEYDQRGVVDRIDGVGDPDVITQRIMSALSARGYATKR